VVCICNGEIYNFMELRAELEARGHRFSTATDVEVIVHLYEEHGEQSFERLRGMFAFALWDQGKRKLVLARDRYGIKPLYLANTDGRLSFASEIAPLLALGAQARPDLQALADFLSLGYVPGTATGLAGVSALPAGHVLTWHDGSGAIGPLPSSNLLSAISKKPFATRFGFISGRMSHWLCCSLVVSIRV